MGLWERVTGRFRLRGMLAEDVPDDAEPAKQVRLQRPPPTPTTRVPERPEETPSMKRRERGEATAGTPTYGTPKGTPSTRRIHNPTHFK